MSVDNMNGDSNLFLSL